MRNWLNKDYIPHEHIDESFSEFLDSIVKYSW